MKQEDRDLLLRDLCSRLPYGVKVKSTFYNCDGTIWKYENEILTVCLLVYPIERYKPYLFPLSSMTEEQKEEYNQSRLKDLRMLNSVLMERTIEGNNFDRLVVAYNETDWLNKNHFDYRGLIEKDLALDATGLNIY